MASDTRTDDAGGRSRSVRRLVGGQRHSVRSTVLAVVLALLCGAYAAWLLADFGLRWPALLAVAAIAGVFFYSRRTPAAMLASGFYGLAVLVVLTPIALDLAFVFAADGYGITPWPFVLSLADLVFLGVFVVFALILSAIGFVINRRADAGDETDSEDAAVPEG
jgi:hypothetical protein